MRRWAGRWPRRTALAGFDHPAAHRTLHWDLKQAATAREYLPLLTASSGPWWSRFSQTGSGSSGRALPHSVIHNDANDYNVLVDEAGSRVVSLLDFGDMVYSATAGNLAVALAYAMLDREDPMAAAAQVAAGYRERGALARPRSMCSITLAGARLAMSVCYCAWQAGRARERVPEHPNRARVGAARKAGVVSRRMAHRGLAAGLPASARARRGLANRGAGISDRR